MDSAAYLVPETRKSPKFHHEYSEAQIESNNMTWSEKQRLRLMDNLGVKDADWGAKGLNLYRRLLFRYLQLTDYPFYDLLNCEEPPGVGGLFM